MHVHSRVSACGKTISLKEAAYERLRAARRYSEESFSAVVLRATWPESTTTGKALLEDATSAVSAEPSSLQASSTASRR